MQTAHIVPCHPKCTCVVIYKCGAGFHRQVPIHNPAKTAKLCCQAASDRMY